MFRDAMLPSYVDQLSSVKRKRLDDKAPLFLADLVQRRVGAEGPTEALPRAGGSVRGEPRPGQDVPAAKVRKDARKFGIV